VSKAQNELSFLVTMPPLGFATYIVLTAAKATKQSVITRPNGNDVIYSGVDFKATFDGNSGAIKMITLADGRQFPFTSGFHYYKEMRGDNRDADHRASGAYVFRPDGSTPVDLSKNLQSKFVENDHFAEVHQKWNDWVSQTIRIYKSESFVEFDYVIGPIDISDNVGKEVIARFDSQLKSNSIFFTDANAISDLHGSLMSLKLFLVIIILSIQEYSSRIWHQDNK
jgi:lysosomal alpha-mannosidase